MPADGRPSSKSTRPSSQSGRPSSQSKRPSSQSTRPSSQSTRPPSQSDLPANEMNPPSYSQFDQPPNQLDRPPSQTDRQSSKSDRKSSNQSARPSSRRNNPAAAKAKEAKTKMLIWEKRILLAAFACGILAAFLYLVAFSSEYWVWVKFNDGGKYRNDTHKGRNPDEAVYYKTGHYHGLWKYCRQEFRNDTGHTTHCVPTYFKLPSYIEEPDIPDESKILDFRRSTVAVGFICIIVSLFANFFVYYSLGQLRYMYKRLSGCLILITGASSWVTLEVFKQSVYFEELHTKKGEPNSDIAFGWSYNIVWFVLILYVFDGVVNLVCSRKRKGVKARSVREARENEPVYLGRI